MTDFFDDAIDSTFIWQREIRDTDDKLQSASSYQEMIAIVEDFLLGILRKKKIWRHPIERAFLAMDRPGQTPSLDYLADQSCLSIRQFERKCRERIGLNPRLYCRILRFSQAFRMKERFP